MQPAAWHAFVRPCCSAQQARVLCPESDLSPAAAMASLTNLSVYGFQHSSQISQDEPLALYLHFELGSESQSSSVVKAGTGSTLEWSSDSLRFAEPSSTMQVRKLRAISPTKLRTAQS